MDTRKRCLAFITLGLFILAAPVTLLAHEPADREHKGHHHGNHHHKDHDSRIVIVHDGDEEVVIDMDEIHEAMAEAMEGLDDAMAELQDMQLQVRLGQDNRLDLSYDDTTFELDLDQIMTQVAAAVQVGFDEFNTSQWTHRHDRWSHASDEELRDELKDLQREMKELRRELRELKDLDDD